MIWPALATTSAAALAAWAVRSPRSSLLGPVVWQGPQTKRQIALTFDDGPSESTPALLDLLDSHAAKATFFVCGANVRRLPGVAREIAARGHELANHTMTHQPLYLKSHAAIQREVVDAQSEIAGVTGAPPKLFRPPFGCRWPGLAGVLRQADLRLVMWSAIGCDWRLPASGVAARLQAAARPGAIFCLHDGRELTLQPEIAATIGAVRVIMPRLGQDGFRFPTVSEFICPTPSSNVLSR
ncbi:MAG: polysaccharide deacetylase family protein [Bryobacteraceae bacterium]|nr:polysaccharide deacetylase family protein [Bryobacteraceae bacterium]